MSTNMRKRRRLTIGLFLALVLVNVASALLLFTGQAQAQPLSPDALELRRRRLHTFAQCLERDVIDEDDVIEDFGDLFDHNEDELQVIVVGFDRERGNGVMNCSTAIRQGLEELEPDAGNHELWLIEELTGHAFDPNGGSIPNDDIERNRQALYNRVKDLQNSLPNATDAMRAERYFPLVDICYDREDLPAPRHITPGRDFVIEGIGAFYFKDDLDDDSLDFLHQEGFGNNVDLGDIELGFLSENGPGSVGDWDPWGSDFYPIGSDVPRETGGYLRDAIVACDFVYKNRDLIFADARLVDGEIVGPNGNPLGASSAPPAAGEEDDPSCESEGAELSWVLCPILFALDKFIGGLDEAIQNMLIIPNAYIEDPDLRQAWAYLRNIAYTVLVPIMLVMVIGTALGFEFFSAYTVKRALPRLIAATLFITFSWQLMTFLVVLINNVGLGLGGIIAQPFGGIDNITLASIMSPDGGDSATITTGTVFTTLLTFPLLLANIPVILSLAFTTAVGLLIGFVLLSFRQLLVMALLLLAPLAILAWIFPGNDKLWKLWWGTFSKLLLLFPLIMILIASGRALAQVSSDIESSLVGTVIKIIAYIGPYFMIPAMFKFAGGLFASIAGITNDKSRGFFDKQKEKRQQTAAENMAKWKTGGLRYGSDRNRFTRGLQRASDVSNSFGANVGTGTTGMFGLRRSVARQRMDQAKEERAVGEVMRNARWQSISQNGDALRAGTYETEREAREGLRDLWTERDDAGNVINAEARDRRVDDAVNSYKATGYRFGDRSAQLANARQMFSTGTDYDDIEDAGGVIARVSHGSYGLISSTAGFGNFETKRAGRPDIAPGYANLRDTAARASTTAGELDDVRVNMPASQAEYDAETERINLAATRSVDVVGRLRGKGPGVRNDGRMLSEALNAGVARLEGTDERLTELDAQLASGTLNQEQTVQVNQARTQVVEQRTQVEDQVKRIIGQIDQYDNNRSYGSDENQQAVREMVEETNTMRDRALSSLGGGANVSYDIRTGQRVIAGGNPQLVARHTRDIVRYGNTERQAANDPNMQIPEPPAPTNDPNNP